MGDISILLSAPILKYNVGLLNSCLYRKMLVNLRLLLYYKSDCEETDIDGFVLKRSTIFLSEEWFYLKP